MLVRFWGTRGSLPVALTGAGVRSKIKQALLQANGRRFDEDAAVERFIDEELDFPHPAQLRWQLRVYGDRGWYRVHGVRYGLGAARISGNRLCASTVQGNLRCIIFSCPMCIGITSWASPFFHLPIFPATRFASMGVTPLPVLQEAFHRQQSDPCFPVDWKNLGADIQLIHLEPEQWYEMNGFRVKAKLQPHHGDSYGYRFEKDGKVRGLFDGWRT